VTIDEAALIAGLLVALGGPAHEAALGALLDIATTASSGSRSRDVASA
jgi:hypothetical protein